MQSAQEMTDKPHIIADCDIPFLKGVLEPYADMEYLKGSEISHADALRADALIIRTRTRCDGRLLDGTPVRLIATGTTTSTLRTAANTGSKSGRRRDATPGAYCNT